MEKKFEKKEAICFYICLAIIIFIFGRLKQFEGDDPDRLFDSLFSGYSDVGDYDFDIDEFNLKCKELENKYNIKLVYGQEGDTPALRQVQQTIFYELRTPDSTVMRGLECVDEILSRLPSEMLMEAKQIGGNYNISYNYIYICCCSELYQENNEGRMELGGCQMIMNDSCYIYLNIYDSDYYTKQCFSHELFHFFDDRIEYTQPNSGFLNWNDLNPKNFYYKNLVERDYPEYYSIFDTEDLSNIYFVSDYSTESKYEDMAEVFSYMLSTDEDDELPLAYQGLHVRAKMNRIIGMMEDSFTCVNGGEYWTRWS